MKSKILNILSVIFGLIFMNGGLSKFFNYMPVPEDLPEAIARDNEALVEIIWLMPLIAVAEILGGLLILFPKTRAVGTLVILPIMVGILLTHIFVAPAGLLIALFLWALLLWILYEDRHRYYYLLK